MANGTIGVSQIDVLTTSGTGTVSIVPPATNTNRTLTLPDATGTINTSGAVNEVPTGTVSAPSITFTGDTNTGIFSPAADTIAFAEGGAEAMRIDSSGNVGIGTSSPTGKLHVEGATQGDLKLQKAGTSGVSLLSDAAGTFKVYDNASAAYRMTITSDGEVLVGGSTVMPEIFSGLGSAGLQIQKNVGGSLAFFRNDTIVSGGNNFGVIGFFGNDTTSNNPTLHAYIGAEASSTHAAGDNPTDLVFGTTPDGSATVTEAMRILNNGDAQINGATVGRGGSVIATNTTLGFNALFSNTTGALNTAVGYQALGSNSTGAENTAVGTFALQANTTGVDNTAVGYAALSTNTTGIRNTALGRGALSLNITGSSNTAVGRNALASSTASNNTAVGREALEANTTGAQNVAVGSAALLLNTTGIDNTAIGTLALDACTTGSENTAVGVNALGALTTGVNNTAVGSEAANEITTGTGNTVIGYNASASAATGVDQIVLGNGVTGQANTNVTIGNGTGKIYNAYTVNATWTQTSDERLKRNIQDDTLGLSFINRLRPVKYQWKPSNEIDQSLPYYNEENNRDIATVMHGLVAQEVKAALDAEGVTTFAGWDMGEDTIQAISREMFVSPLIKAIQELSAKVTALEAQLSTTTGRT